MIVKILIIVHFLKRIKSFFSIQATKVQQKNDIRKLFGYFPKKFAYIKKKL